MKYLCMSIGMLLTLLAALSLNAQKLYTWTDENGVVHLTDQPPPDKDRVENVEEIRYEEKTPQDIEAIQHRKENLRRQLEREERIEKARQAEIRATKAEERAIEAVQQAQEEFEYYDQYIRRLSSSRNKRKKFRKRIGRIKAETEVSQAEANAALEQAQEAVQKARLAAEEAQIDQNY